MQGDGLGIYRPQCLRKHRRLDRASQPARGMPVQEGSTSRHTLRSTWAAVLPSPPPPRAMGTAAGADGALAVVNALATVVARVSTADLQTARIWVLAVRSGFIIIEYGGLIRVELRRKNPPRR